MAKPLTFTYTRTPGISAVVALNVAALLATLLAEAAYGTGIVAQLVSHLGALLIIPRIAQLGAPVTAIFIAWAVAASMLYHVSRGYGEVELHLSTVGWTLPYGSARRLDVAGSSSLAVVGMGIVTVPEALSYAGLVGFALTGAQYMVLTSSGTDEMMKIVPLVGGLGFFAVAVSRFRDAENISIPKLRALAAGGLLLVTGITLFFFDSGRYNRLHSLWHIAVYGSLSIVLFVVLSDDPRVAPLFSYGYPGEVLLCPLVWRYPASRTAVARAVPDGRVRRDGSDATLARAQHMADTDVDTALES